ncbi:MAG: hypothetical protein KKG76_05170 [Euryarchaeota archaeon]|nr:hypothetical protein [Euryarchaeota archaeon]
MEEIKKATDIIDILFNYVEENFDNFGHKDWEHTEKYGTSWSPFVETCFMLEAMNTGLYKILCCYTHDNIDTYIHDFHEKEFGEMYEMYSLKKFPCRCIDVAWLDLNNRYFLAVEHSEDIPDQVKIQEQEYVLNYKDDEDETVNGKAKDQLIAIRDEINKLKSINSHFKVLVSRPHRFKSIDGQTESLPNYNQSVEYFMKHIQDDLKKDAKSFNDDEIWVIILIAPDPDKPKSRSVKPDKIIFHCFEWNGKNEVGKLYVIDEKHEKYAIPIKIVNGKWVKNSTKQPDDLLKN